jgi:hypothetical protein
MDLPRIFSRSTAGQAMQAEVTKSDLTVRRSLVKRRIELIADDPKGLQIAGKVRDADARVAELAAAIEHAKAARQAARAELSSHGAVRERELNLLEAELRETASPLIDLALAYLDGVWERARHTLFVGARIRRSDGSFGYSDSDVSYAAELATRVGRISAARDLTRALKLEALDDAQLARRIAEIRASIDEPAPATA